MNNPFSDWLQRQLDARGWSQSEAARRSEGTISSQMISQVLSGTAKPGLEFCRAVARAFGVPLEEVFRIAGILPPVATREKDVKTLLARLNEMDPDQRAELVALINAIIHFRDRAAGASAPSRKDARRRQNGEREVTDDPEEDWRELRAAYESLPKESRQELSHELQRMLSARQNPATEPPQDQ